MKPVKYALLLLPSVTAFHIAQMPSRYELRLSSRMGTSASYGRGNTVSMSVKNRQGGIPRLPPPDDSKKDDEIPTDNHDGRTRAVIGEVTTNRKMTLSFTCNLCEHRTTRAINRVSYTKGIVVVWCEGCGQKHLIADNLGKMDFPWFGRNIEEYMAQKGTPVKRLVFDETGIGSVEARIPGVHFPAGVTPGEESFVGDVILPDPHVGDIVLPEVPPLDFGSGEVERLVEDTEGHAEEDDPGVDDS